MRMLTFSNRTAKEILRDPLNLAFGLGFPVALLLLLSAIQANIPVKMFELDKLTPGITVFGLAFMTLFSATLVAKDRESALLQRLYTTPLTAMDFIFAYTSYCNCSKYCVLYCSRNFRTKNNSNYSVCFTCNYPNFIILYLSGFTMW